MMLEFAGVVWTYQLEITMKSVFFSFFLVVLLGVQSCSSDSNPIIEDIEDPSAGFFSIYNKSEKSYVKNQVMSQLATPC